MSTLAGLDAPPAATTDSRRTASTWPATAWPAPTAPPAGSDSARNLVPRELGAVSRGSIEQAVHRPGPVPLGLVRLATQALPAGEVRQRYRFELVADLQYLDRPHQVSYAAGVVSTVWALRREAISEVSMRDMPTTHTVPLLCRLGLKHHWHWESTEDGQRYECCARCGKDSNRAPRGPFDVITG